MRLTGQLLWDFYETANEPKSGYVLIRQSARRRTPFRDNLKAFLTTGKGAVTIDDHLLRCEIDSGVQKYALFQGGAMHGKQSISFTFPEIQEFWDRLVRRWLMLSLATIGTRQGMGEGPYLVVLLVFGGLQLALSLAYWNRENKLIPRINERLAVESMLRTDTPAPPEDLDVLQVKQTVTARDESGAAHRWIVKRRRDVFTLASA